MRKYDCQFSVEGSNGFCYLINGFYNEANSDILDRASKFYGVRMTWVINGDII